MFLGLSDMNIISYFHSAYQEAFDAASAQIAEFDAKMGELESPDHLNTRKAQIQGEMRTNKNKLNEYNVRY